MKEKHMEELHVGGSVVECLTQDRGVVGFESDHRHSNVSKILLFQPRKVLTYLKIVNWDLKHQHL